MAKTVGDAIAEARAILHDTTEQVYRYTTADLYAYLNNALLETRRVRPDLFRAYLGTDTPEFAPGDEGEAFPIDAMYFTPVVLYIAGTAELRDDEFTVDARAVTLMQQFAAKLLMVT